MTLIHSQSHQPTNSSLPTEEAFKAQLTPLSQSPGLLTGGYLMVKDNILQQTHILRYWLECVKNFFKIENHIDEHEIQYKTLELLLDNKEFLNLPDCAPLVQNLAKRVGLTYFPKNAPPELKELIRDISCALLLSKGEKTDRHPVTEQKTSADLLNRFSEYYHLPVEIKKIDTVVNQSFLGQNPIVSAQKENEKLSIEENEGIEPENPIQPAIDEQGVETNPEEIPPLTIKVTRLAEKTSSIKNWQIATGVTVAALGALSALIWYNTQETAPFNNIPQTGVVPYNSANVYPFNPFIGTTSLSPDYFAHISNHTWTAITSIVIKNDENIGNQADENLGTQLAAIAIVGGSIGIAALYRTATCTHFLYKKCTEEKRSLEEEEKRSLKEETDYRNIRMKVRDPNIGTEINAAYQIILNLWQEKFNKGLAAEEDRPDRHLDYRNHADVIKFRSEQADDLSKAPPSSTDDHHLPVNDPDNEVDERHDILPWNWNPSPLLITKDKDQKVNKPNNPTEGSNDKSCNIL